jgi:hypothetical protein
MAWTFVERCWRLLRDKVKQLWDYLSGDDCLILPPVPARAARRQVTRCAPNAVKSPLDPNRFELD